MCYGLEWKTEGMRLDVKEVIKASRDFGRHGPSSFLHMDDNLICSHTLPDTPVTHQFHIELDEIDF